MPTYGFIGLALLIVSESAMLAQIEPFWSWHTPFAWTGYILLVDAIVWKARGSSWLTRHRREFFFLTLASIPLWLIFEAYNLLIKNWYYVNLPANQTMRYVGYGWAFATIWPGIFETADLVAVVRERSRDWVTRRSVADNRFGVLTSRQCSGLQTTLAVAGAVMLLWPLVWPSPYLAAPVFLGFVLLLDPLNSQAGDESLLSDLTRPGVGKWDRIVNLVSAGFISGFLWEFWNYWARSKWIYTVPILSEFKIFEMPILGYLGFPAFALECFTMYVLCRRLVWHGPVRPVALPN